MGAWHTRLDALAAVCFCTEPLHRHILSLYYGIIQQNPRQGGLCVVGHLSVSDRKAWTLITDE